jgi:hypothetical protein
LKRKVPLASFTYEKQLWHAPLGEIWQVQAASGETRWAYHLQGFALETMAEQEKAITYLQNLRHAALLRFKVGELAAHRICLLFDPWGPSLLERCRSGKLSDQELLRALAETAHAVDELTALTNLEHLGLCPDTIVQGLDSEQLRDFGLISLLWKSGQKPLDALNPHYSAPELARGQPRPSSDQYSLAVTYADLRTLRLTGKPWVGPRSRPGAVDLASIPAPERPVLQKALDPDPERRFTTCVELIDALAEAQGGTASQTTTAVHGALAATQESFLTTLGDWIERQEGASRGAAPGMAAADGGLRDLVVVDIVPGTARLHLEVFQQEWQAQELLAKENEFRFFVPLVRSFWQRLRGQVVGVDVQVLLETVGPVARKNLRAMIDIRPFNCNGALTRHIGDTLAPAMLNTLRQCLNAVADRRIEPRLLLRAEVMVRYRAPGGRPTEHAGEIFNISRKGIGLVTTEPIHPGGEIRMILSLPQEGDQPVALLLKAVVKRCETLAGGKYELGAEFVHEPAKPV